jgi:threonine dehydratase
MLGIVPDTSPEPGHYDRAMVERSDVERAAEVIRGRLHRTPLLSCRTLGPHAFLKAELLQRTGSFKPRGVLTKLASLSPEEKARGVIAISAGNHAQAVAWGAAEEGIDALVVMWQGASEAKIAATKEYGAAVDLEATDPRGAFDRLDVLLGETGRTLVHPFDDPLTIAGQGTVGLEILEDYPEVDAIVVPIGGGGLIAGVAVAGAGRARLL